MVKSKNKTESEAKNASIRCGKVVPKSHEGMATTFSPTTPSQLSNILLDDDYSDPKFSTYPSSSDVFTFLKAVDDPILKRRLECN